MEIYIRSNASKTIFSCTFLSAIIKRNKVCNLQLNSYSNARIINSYFNKKMYFAIFYPSKSFNCALATSAKSIHTAHVSQGVTHYIAVGHIKPHVLCEVTQI